MLGIMNSVSHTTEYMYIYRLLPQSSRLTKKMLYMCLPVSHISLYTHNFPNTTLSTTKNNSLPTLVYLASQSIF
jgi:hypothetical protein